MGVDVGLYVYLIFRLEEYSLPARKLRSKKNKKAFFLNESALKVHSRRTQTGKVRETGRVA